MSTKSITINIYNKETSQEWKANYQEFDQNGNEILTEDYDYDGSVSSRIATKYDDLKRKKEISIYGEGDFLSERHVFEYQGNSDRILAEEIVYADMSKSIKAYDYGDHKIQIITKNEDDEVEEQEYQEFDNDGNLISTKIIDDFDKIVTYQKSIFEDKKIVKRIELDENENEVQHTDFIYNENGKIIKTKVFTPNGKLVDFNNFAYDEKGREILRQIGSRGTVTTEYNDETRQVNSTTRIGNGQVYASEITTYDEKGRIIEEQSTTETKTFVYTEW